jgi:phosphoglycolate phosphatase
MGLLLFDIDGTITLGSGDYNVSLEEAIKIIFGVPDVKVNLDRFHGFTDKLVLEQLLREHDIKYDSSSIARCLKTFGELYPENPKDITIIPGAYEAISQLEEKHTLGIVSGNVKLMAKKKLKTGGLYEYFPFGGFGSDPHEKRSDLVSLAVRHARKIFDWKGDNSSIYVIDDAPLGIIAAHEAEVNAIGVTTGKYSRDQLLAKNPRYVIDNLRELLTLPL